MIARFQSPICGADAQRPTIKPQRRELWLGFNPLFAGLTLKANMCLRCAYREMGFNPLFAGLTLKVSSVRMS